MVLLARFYPDYKALGRMSLLTLVTALRKKNPGKGNDQTCSLKRGEMFRVPGSGKRCGRRRFIVFTKTAHVEVRFAEARPHKACFLTSEGLVMTKSSQSKHSALNGSAKRPSSLAAFIFS